MPGYLRPRERPRFRKASPAQENPELIRTWRSDDRSHGPHRLAEGTLSESSLRKSSQPARLEK